MQTVADLKSDIQKKEQIPVQDSRIRISFWEFRDGGFLTLGVPPNQLIHFFEEVCIVNLSLWGFPLTMETSEVVHPDHTSGSCPGHPWTAVLGQEQLLIFNELTGSQMAGFVHSPFGVMLCRDHWDPNWDPLGIFRQSRHLHDFGASAAIVCIH